jgi:transposase
MYISKCGILFIYFAEKERPMFLRSITIKGVTRLYFYESYYENGRTKQKCIENLGRLDELQKRFDDPVSHFKKVAEEKNAEQNTSRKTSVPIDLSSTMSTSEDNLRNVGYAVLKDLYKQLELDKFWKLVLRKTSIQYDLEAVFRLLVFSRILYPGSKRDTFLNKSAYFEDMDGFSLKDTYKALDVFDQYDEQLQKWIYSHSSKICERDMSVSYFDCTNYYFDIGRSDMDTFDDDGRPVDGKGNPAEIKYRKRGPEKNHRPDPIVEMGLLMDKDGIPLAFDLFPGNESEKVHMRPIINRVKSQFGSGRVIFVADRGLNTSDNIYFLNGDNKADHNPRDGYVYGQSVRGADAEFKAWVLKGDYKTEKLTDDDGREVTFTHKSRIHPKTIQVNTTVPGQKKKRKKSVSIDQKQMAYYSEKYAKKQKHDRDIMVARAKDLIKHPKKYDKITAAGSGAYVQNIAFDKSTGEIIEGRELVLDEAKIAEEEKYDGYYSIVTSELKMSDHEMRETYRGLARIEETFKISKTEFESRPVFVWTNEHIEGHFATCFTALVLIRLLQSKLGSRYPIGKTIESLRKYNCTQIGTTLYQFVYYDEILEECGKIFHLELNNRYRTREQIRRLLKY